MDVLAALLAALSVGMLALAIIPAEDTSRYSLPRIFHRSVEKYNAQLRAARLHIDAHKFTIVCFATPLLVFVVGLLIGSPVVAIVGGLLGFAAPRLYLNALLGAQRRRTEAEAPRFLHILVASLTAGRTYLEALQEARQRVTDRWLREDLDHIIRQFHLDISLEKSIADVCSLATGHNLTLIWNNLAICVGQRIPASRAKGLLTELSSTVQYNVQVQEEVRARTSGQRVQIWLLALVVPGLFFYLRLINPDFFVVLDSTFVGRFLMFPAAAALEVIGIVLSVRVSRVEV